MVKCRVNRSYFEGVIRSFIKFLIVPNAKVAKLWCSSIGRTKISTCRYWVFSKLTRTQNRPFFKLRPRDERTRKLFENMFANIFLFPNKTRTRTWKIFDIENKNRTRTEKIQVKNTVLNIGKNNTSQTHFQTDFCLDWLCFFHSRPSTYAWGALKF